MSSSSPPRMAASSQGSDRRVDAMAPTMKPRATNVSKTKAVWFGIAIAGGISALLGREAWRAKQLRSELDAARKMKAELRQLESENHRLEDQQIPAAELERLRADHAALPRLRSEVEQLRTTAPVAP